MSEQPKYTIDVDPPVTEEQLRAKILTKFGVVTERVFRELIHHDGEEVDIQVLVDNSVILFGKEELVQKALHVLRYLWIRTEQEGVVVEARVFHKWAGQTNRS